MPLSKKGTVTHGARVTEVGEPLDTIESTLFRSEPIFRVEFGFIAEPKALLPADLRVLVKKYGTYQKASEAIGASEAFVRLNSKTKIKKGSAYGKNR